jgi:hypothetical protein
LVGLDLLADACGHCRVAGGTEFAPLAVPGCARLSRHVHVRQWPLRGGAP